MNRSGSGWRKLVVSVALLTAAAVVTSCSFMGLDDLELVSCDRALDCYASPEAVLEECYRCRAGRCERAGALRVQSTDTVSGSVLGVRATPGVDRSTLVTVAARGPDDPHVWGWRVDADHDLTNLGEVRYSVGGNLAESVCPSADNPHKPCILRDHATTALSDDLALGMSIDLAGCTSGRVQLGLATADTPLSLQADASRGPIATGFDSTSGGCRAANGASAPAIAARAIRSSDVEAEALAVWLGAAPSAAAVGCSASDAQPVPVWSLPLALESVEDRGWTIGSEDGAAPVQRGAGFPHIAPQLLAAAGQADLGYLLVFADSKGIHLVPLASATSPGAAHLEPVTRVGQLATALGPSRGGGQEVLLAWTRGCAPSMELWATVYRWTGGRVERLLKPRRLPAGGSILSGPAVAFSPAGFTLQAPTGGWSLAWAEARGGMQSLQATRVSQATRVVLPPTEVYRGDVAQVFVHAANAAPFSYGFVSSRAGELAVLACD